MKKVIALVVLISAAVPFYQGQAAINSLNGQTDTTLYIGSNTQTSCLAMGDSDGSGITYITVNNGVISATAVKPGICQ